MRRSAVPTFLIVIATIALQTQACEKSEMATGCRINAGTCSCGWGCKQEFRYPDMEKCKLALAGTPPNLCDSPERCLHGGACSQISPEPGYRCLCVRTGYFGTNCEKPCPERNDPNYRGLFPSDCLSVI
ncbi:hypothetical protein QAD02_023534 [Eretmocerus hayati]|uniref:Uncharacterized protein n=1 Tax=Eretmocerus hayati TaxID=131215 RepID=A0ACC2PWE8_9HYME|nr:hypothetical protein QAD02_023534 [Eretmocerus hayati]